MEKFLKKTVKNTAIIFLKAPRKGTVKTRLAKTIGDSKALDAYRNMAMHQLQAIPQNWSTKIYFAPSTAQTEMQNWLNNQSSFYPQIEGDLGARLSEAVQTHFKTSGSALHLIGADCPWLDHNILDLAATRLESADIVIGPTFDGGYYLLGIKKCYHSLFENISWSSELVFKQTLKKAKALNLHVELLPKLHDVDTLEEWEIAKKQFSGLNSK